MSEFGSMIFDMLTMNSEIQKTNNPFRKVLDNSMGEYMDNLELPFEQLFVTSATGGWLDAYGKDYGIPRRLDESDDDYRKRLIYEKLDHLTPSLLVEEYDVLLYSFVDDFDATDNMLTSDNPYNNLDGYMGIADETTQDILENKFIMDTGVEWI